MSDKVMTDATEILAYARGYEDGKQDAPATRPVNHTDLSPAAVTIPADAWMRLRIAGDLLSNCALSVTKTSGANRPLSKRAYDSLAECSAEWDAAKEAVHQLLQGVRHG